jgi:hypothetical protein
LVAGVLSVPLGIVVDGIGVVEGAVLGRVEGVVCCGRVVGMVLGMVVLGRFLQPVIRVAARIIIAAVI